MSLQEPQHLGDGSLLGKQALSWPVNESRSLLSSARKLSFQRFEKPRGLLKSAGLGCMGLGWDGYRGVGGVLKEGRPWSAPCFPMQGSSSFANLSSPALVREEGCWGRFGREALPLTLLTPSVQTRLFSTYTGKAGALKPNNETNSKLGAYSPPDKGGVCILLSGESKPSLAAPGSLRPAALQPSLSPPARQGPLSLLRVAGRHVHAPPVSLIGLAVLRSGIDPGLVFLQLFARELCTHSYTSVFTASRRLYCRLQICSASSCWWIFLLVWT